MIISYFLMQLTIFPKFDFKYLTQSVLQGGSHIWNEIKAHFTFHNHISHFTATFHIFTNKTSIHKNYYSKKIDPKCKKICTIHPSFMLYCFREWTLAEVNFTNILWAAFMHPGVNLINIYAWIFCTKVDSAAFL